MGSCNRPDIRRSGEVKPAGRLIACGDCNHYTEIYAGELRELIISGYTLLYKY